MSCKKTDGDSEELAENRTELAEDRTVMANERTFSSWVGAGLGCVGLGLGVEAIFKEAEPTWIAKLAATVFMLTALAVFYAAWRNACLTLERLQAHERAPVSKSQLSRISLALCIGTALVTAILWTL